MDVVEMVAEENNDGEYNCNAHSGVGNGPSTINPLLNDLVMDCIFDLLSFQDILNCRLVCQQWYTHTLVKQIMQDSTLLSFGDDASNCAKHLERLSKFNSTMKESYYLPCHKFSLSYLPVKEPIVEEFLEICGPTIKYLKLRMSKEDMNIFDFSEMLVKSLPSLHTLEIAGFSNRAVYSQKLFSEYENIPALPNIKCLIIQEVRIRVINFLAAFFQAAINLEEIIVSSDTRRDWDNQTGIMNAHSPATASVLTGLIYAIKNISKLKHLKVEILDRSNINVLINLAQQGMKLISLEMKGVSKDCDNEIFEDFLETQKDSLQIFKTFQAKLNKRKRNQEDVEQFRLKFPTVMNELIYLQLAYRHKDQSVPVFPISYYSQLPHLDVLVIHGCASLMNLNEYFPFLVNPIPQTSLRKLVLPSGIEDDMFPAGLARIFPNVTDLEISCPSNSFLQCLWSSWVKINVLRIITAPDDNLDAGFTGISQLICQRLLHHYSLTQEIEQLDNQKNSTSICNLQDLKKLTLIIQVENTDTHISILTDVTGYYAFSNMKHLQHLEIISTHWYEGVLPIDCSGLSPECRNEIKKRLPDASIFFGDKASKMDL